MPTGRPFWIFHSVFWLCAGVALFLYGLGYGHWEVALIRNLYNPLVGFVYSLLMRSVYTHRLPQHTVSRLALIAGLSLGGALVSALLVNPVTYALLGYDIQSLSLLQLLQDGLYFLLFYVIWSLIYLSLSQGQPAAPAVQANAKLTSIPVSKGNRNLVLQIGDITHVLASGDYVEFFTADDRYLKPGSIGTWEQTLSDGPFVRVHRSVMVNRMKIVSVVGPSKGQFLIQLENGHEVRSSRRYQSVIESLVPKAS